MADSFQPRLSHRTERSDLTGDHLGDRVGNRDPHFGPDSIFHGPRPQSLGRLPVAAVHQSAVDIAVLKPGAAAGDRGVRLSVSVANHGDAAVRYTHSLQLGIDRIGSRAAAENQAEAVTGNRAPVQHVSGEGDARCDRESVARVVPGEDIAKDIVLQGGLGMCVKLEPDPVIVPVDVIVDQVRIAGCGLRAGHGPFDQRAVRVDAAIDSNRAEDFVANSLDAGRIGLDHDRRFGHRADRDAVLNGVVTAVVDVDVRNLRPVLTAFPAVPAQPVRETASDDVIGSLEDIDHLPSGARLRRSPRGDSARPERSEE